MKHVKGYEILDFKNSLKLTSFQNKILLDASTIIQIIA